MSLLVPFEDALVRMKSKKRFGLYILMYRGILRVVPCLTSVNHGWSCFTALFRYVSDLGWESQLDFGDSYKMSHIIWVIFDSLQILNGFDWFDYSFARIVQSETCVTVTDPSLELLEQIEKFIFKIANKRWLLIDCFIKIKFNLF